MIAGSAGRRFLWLTVALSYYAISFNAGNLSDYIENYAGVAKTLRNSEFAAFLDSES